MSRRSTAPRLLATLVTLLALGGCTTLRTPRLPDVSPPPPTFSHDDFDRMLQRFVDDHGRVDYASLQRDPADLERYYELIARYSPDSHPDLFPTQDSKLTYWINAYNAVAIKIVLQYYPIASITDISTPFPLSLLSPRGGFFFLNRATFGGKTTSLYYLENFVIRKRFAEPRVHFALNCASRGCPRLPQEAFAPDRLDEQLERETRRFFSEERNLHIDHARRTLYFSSVLKWFEDDFLEWYRARYPAMQPTLLAYAALYAPERAAELERAATYDIQFSAYDWRLNDRREFAHAVR